VFVRNYLHAAGVFVAAYCLRSRFPSAPPFDFLAKISYPLYVSHAVLGYAALHFLVQAGLPNYVSLMGAVLLAFTVATALHYAVEAPSQRLSKRLGGLLARPSRVDRAVDLHRAAGVAHGRHEIDSRGY
jgi:peptidoglycan/LPS O-acetylase OafA/YrhL